ncbi:MAG TPA: sulfatase [Thermoleophilaceae bacterium]|nr:sulfatase [Thermoleophilaceae bacterium]
MRQLITLAATVLALAALVPAAAAARPNVVVLMTDDQTLASMRYMPQTRSLIGDAGVTFTSEITSYPLCCPSRVTQLTGQYAHNHGILHNAGPFGGFVNFDHGNDLPSWLQRAGYRTMHVGRYLNGYGEASGVPAGWSDWHATVGRSAFNYTAWRVNENGVIGSYPAPAGPPEHQTDFLGRRAAELIDEAAPGERPFYLSLWFSAPHRGGPRDADDPPIVGSPSPAPRHRDAFAGVPMPRPPSFDEASVRDKPQLVADRPRLTPEVEAAIEENWRQEIESLLSVDDAVARVIGTLERSGELQNTVIIYTSDNGFMHGEHRREREKVVPYEESIRTPLLVRGPGIPRGRRDRRLVANVDVAPTILDAADAVPGRTLDGRSLFPLFADATLQWGRDILLENGHGANSVGPYRGIRTTRFKYVRHRTTGEYELYDLRNDPYELTNLDGRARYGGVQARMAARLRRLQRCVGAGCSTRPALRLFVRSRPGAGAGRRSCLRGEVRVRVGGRDRGRVLRADILAGRRRVARIRRPPLVRSLPRSEVRRGRRTLLRLRAELRDGRLLTLDRRVDGCG